jgi:hypothetical protein
MGIGVKTYGVLRLLECLIKLTKSIEEHCDIGVENGRIWVDANDFLGSLKSFPIPPKIRTLHSFEEWSD